MNWMSRIRNPFWNQTTILKEKTPKFRKSKIRVSLRKKKSTSNNPETKSKFLSSRMKKSREKTKSRMTRMSMKSMKRKWSLLRRSQSGKGPRIRSDSTTTGSSIFGSGF